MKTLLSIVLLLFTQFTLSKRPLHIYMIGDSTMANKAAKAEPERGWGQMLPLFFNDQAVISNHAQNGRSTKSFIDEGRWKIVLDSLQKGDYVIIQFGHNDEKTDTTRHTDPRTSYRSNLIKFISEARNKGAFPILCTSIVRRKFDDKGQLTDTHGDYPVVTREVAAEYKVPLLDLQKKTAQLLQDLGPEKSITLFVYTQPGEYPNRPEGTKDDTHLNISGATKVAGLAVEEMKNQNLPLVSYLK
jgi:DNA sulfur modification protein DndE